MQGLGGESLKKERKKEGRMEIKRIKRQGKRNSESMGEKNKIWVVTGVLTLGLK